MSYVGVLPVLVPPFEHTEPAKALRASAGSLSDSAPPVPLRWEENYWPKPGERNVNSIKM